MAALLILVVAAANCRSVRLGAAIQNASAAAKVIALLGDADLVKFAKAVPDSDICEKMIDGSLRMVRGTIEGLGLVVATPDEARAMLGLKGADKVAF